MIKATEKPIESAGRDSGVNSSGVLARSKTVAANIVGIASKKENKVAVFLDSPRVSPPMIVAPDRETPGKMAIDWKKPIFIA